jgi:predicted DNA-binding transcriptional regulator AlpA
MPPVQALSPVSAAVFCCLSTSYLARLRQDGEKRRLGLPEGPRFRRIGRKVLYLRSDLEAWLSSLPSTRVPVEVAAPKRGRPTKAAVIARRMAMAA